jgi:hypothetical protein
MSAYEYVKVHDAARHSSKQLENMLQKQYSVTVTATVTVTVTVIVTCLS